MQAVNSHSKAAPALTYSDCLRGGELCGRRNAWAEQCDVSEDAQPPVKGSGLSIMEPLCPFVASSVVVERGNLWQEATFSIITEVRECAPHQSDEGGEKKNHTFPSFSLAQQSIKAAASRSQ